MSLVKQAYAQCDPGNGNSAMNLGDCLLLNNTETVETYYNDPADLINLVVRNLFVVAGLFLFIMVFISGYKFISGGTKGKDESKTIISTALTGFVLMFAAYWIIQIIEFITTVEIL